MRMNVEKPPTFLSLPGGALLGTIVYFIMILACCGCDNPKRTIGEVDMKRDPKMELHLSLVDKGANELPGVRITVVNRTGTEHVWDSEWAALLAWSVWLDNKELKFVEKERIPSGVQKIAPGRLRSLKPGESMHTDVSIEKQVRILTYDIAGVGNPVHALAVGRESLVRFDVGGRKEPVSVQVTYWGDDTTLIDAFTTCFAATPEDVKLWYGESRSNKLYLRKRSGSPIGRGLSRPASAYG